MVERRQTYHQRIPGEPLVDQGWNVRPVDDSTGPDAMAKAAFWLEGAVELGLVANSGVAPTPPPISGHREIVVHDDTPLGTYFDFRNSVGRRRFR